MASRVLVLTLLASVAAVEVCPGEGARYGAQAMKPAEPSLHAVLNAFRCCGAGDFRCNHDGTHRVCAQLVDEKTKAPLAWGQEDFWQITGQSVFEHLNTTS